MTSHPSTAGLPGQRRDPGDGRRTLAPYQSAWEHLQDQLERLRLRVLLRLDSKGWQSRDGRLEGFQGLVISEQETAALLDEMGCATRSDANGQPNAVAAALAAIDAAIEAREAISAREQIVLPLVALRTRCGLSQFESQCLVIAAAPDIDLRYERIYAYLQDDVTRRRPTIGLTLDLLCESADEVLAARASFDNQAPLFGYGLCRLGEAVAEGSSLSRPVKLDERLAQWLLGCDRETSLDAAVRLIRSSAVPSPIIVDESLAARLVTFLGTLADGEAAPPPAIVHIRGPRGAGQRALVESVCRKQGWPLLLTDLEELASGPAPFAEAIARLAREALLQAAVVCLDNVDALFADGEKRRAQLHTLFAALRRFSRTSFLLGGEALPLRDWTAGAVFIEVEMPRPDLDRSARLWNAYLAREVSLSPDIEPTELANLFRLGTESIHEAVSAARDRALWRAPDCPVITMADITAACRSANAARLSALANKVSPRQNWNDLVLPADQLAQLREMCNQARYRHVVQSAWGFDRKLPLGRGITALFSGPPGTGKTMAAQVMASELQLDLFQIDLSRVVSKYIGETEKNLRSVFDEADASQAILFFDEADALFGKRSDVKDAHDRYANIEVGYLLQRMEAYEGVAILATNFRQNVDEAFVRRLRFIVEFPFPDEEHRRRIWEVMFPKEAPLAADVDFGVLARELKLAGGHIRNIALAAAFTAAAAGEAIGISQLAQAARREHQKLGKSWSEPLRLAGQRP